MTLVGFFFIVYAFFSYGMRQELDRPRYHTQDVCEAARQGAAAILGTNSVSDTCQEAT